MATNACERPQARSLRQWVTGQIPDTAETVITTPLAAPLYHDSPSTPDTYWGTRCMVRACRKQAPAETRSLRYLPSDICVRCWQRWDKRVTSGKEPAS